MLALAPLGSTSLRAQSVTLNLPRDSQRAMVEQRIGITDITVKYHRPQVKGRNIWGGIVPYGEVWRAGANENTIIEFSDAVTIEGQPLAAGVYGLHMIPGESQWIVIFSKVSSAWGSFTYKQAEDALRVTVKPQAADFHEALAYDFDSPTADSAIITMRWEKVAVSFKVGVNTNQIVAENLHRQLRGLSQYTWDGWDDAANYLLANKTDMEEALTYCDRSIGVEDRFDNELTKSKVLSALGKTQESATALNIALAKANAIQMHTYARGLQIEGQQEKAFAIYRENAKKNPDSWIVHTGLARMYSAQGDYPSAVKEMRLSMNTAPEANKPFLQNFVKRLEAKQDINK
jgi:tetratricopeptide (TPR) repeat protein